MFHSLPILSHPARPPDTSELSLLALASLVCRTGKPVGQDFRFGLLGTDSIADPRLRCNVLRTAYVRSSYLCRSGLQIGSGQGVPAAPGGPSADTTSTLPLGNSPLRLLGAPALASRHRQRPDPPQHLAEQLPVQMPFGQEQPVVVGVLDEPTAGLHQPMLQTR